MIDLLTKGNELVENIVPLDWKAGEPLFQKWKSEITKFLPDIVSKKITAINSIYKIDMEYYLANTMSNIRTGNLMDSHSGGFDKKVIDAFVLNKIIILINDELYKTEAKNPTKTDIEKLKLLKARQTNPKFEMELAEMICGDNEIFPYKTGGQINEFFTNLGFPWRHDGSTRKTWIETQLLTADIHTIYNIITKGLFKKKYFIDDWKDVERAKSAFKLFIKESSEREDCIDISEVFGLNIKNELLFEKETKTSDETFNELVTTSKDLFVSSQKKLALEKLWDAFERLKTLRNTDKKTSCNQILDMITGELERAALEAEFTTLTTIGNNYQIRHYETNKKPITLEIEINYLFFRMLALIDFVLDKINPSLPTDSNDIF